MDTKDALEIVKALQTIGNVLDMRYQQVAAFACFYDEAKIAKINEAIALVIAFDDADLPERGRLLGLNVQEDPDGSFVATCVLSERSENEITW